MQFMLLDLSLNNSLSMVSTINVCLLDMSKAFDKVNNHGFYIKLMKRNLPIKFLNVIIKANAMLLCSGMDVFLSVSMYFVVLGKVVSCPQ